MSVILYLLRTLSQRLPCEDRRGLEISSVRLVLTSRDVKKIGWGSTTRIDGIHNEALDIVL
jgi:hypothetical protein